jgi:hypothetical protein
MWRSSLCEEVTVGAQKENEELCSVHVSHSGEDTVGRRFALALKERIKKSALFRLAESRNDASFGVHIVSVDAAIPPLESEGNRSAIALTFVAVNPSAPDYFLTMGVRLLGSNRVDESADETLADLDKEVDDYNHFRSGGH